MAAMEGRVGESGSLHILIFSLALRRRRPATWALAQHVSVSRYHQDCQNSRRLMSDRMDFEIVCPNDHNQTVTFSQDEFEEALKSGALVFHCNTCDTNWPPSHEDIAKIRKQFAKNSG
jgi:hypothetical protein